MTRKVSPGIILVREEENEQHTMCPGRDLRGGHFGLDEKLRIRDSLTVRIARTKSYGNGDGIRYSRREAAGHNQIRTRKALRLEATVAMRQGSCTQEWLDNDSQRGFMLFIPD